MKKKKHKRTYEKSAQLLMFFFSCVLFRAGWRQVVFITTDGFLNDRGKRNEERLVDNAVRVVREGGNDLAIQLRVKDAGKTRKDRSLARPPARSRGEGGILFDWTRRVPWFSVLAVRVMCACKNGEVWSSSKAICREMRYLTTTEA